MKLIVLCVSPSDCTSQDYILETPPYFCTSSKPGPGSPTSYVVAFLCSTIWGERWLFVLLILVELLTVIVYINIVIQVTVRFVDIVRIVDRHCLYKYCHTAWLFVLLILLELLTIIVYINIVIQGDCSFCWYWWNSWSSLFI